MMSKFVERVCPICKQRMKCRIAFTPVVNPEGPGFILGRAEEGLQGYVPLRYRVYDSEEEAQVIADELNAELGLHRKEAWEVIASTMWQKKEERVNG